MVYTPLIFVQNVTPNNIVVKNGPTNVVVAQNNQPNVIVRTGQASGENLDTSFVSLLDGDFLTYDAASRIWHNTTVDFSVFVRKTTTINGHALSGNVTISKSDVGLGNVENTQLSTWSGSTNITTLGNIISGSIPYALITGKPKNITVGTSPPNSPAIGDIWVDTN